MALACSFWVHFSAHTERPRRAETRPARSLQRAQIPWTTNNGDGRVCRGREPALAAGAHHIGHGLGDAVHMVARNGDMPFIRDEDQFAVGNARGVMAANAGGNHLIVGPMPKQNRHADIFRRERWAPKRKTTPRGSLSQIESNLTRLNRVPSRSIQNRHCAIYCADPRCLQHQPCSFVSSCRKQNYDSRAQPDLTVPKWRPI